MPSTPITVLRILPLAVVVFGLWGLPCAAAQPGATGDAPAVTVTIDDHLRFSPNVLTIKAGTRVRWVNGSVLRHTVTADPAKAARGRDVALPKGAQPFDSGYIDPKGTYQRRFTVPGHYRYFCIPHESTGMVADIIVKE